MGTLWCNFWELLGTRTCTENIQKDDLKLLTFLHTFRGRRGGAGEAARGLDHHNNPDEIKIDRLKESEAVGMLIFSMYVSLKVRLLEG